jgi:uncharacterized protein YjiS (DUF1127 family)
MIRGKIVCRPVVRMPFSGNTAFAKGAAMLTCKENLSIAARLSDRSPGLVDRLVATVFDWRDRVRSRRLLAGMDERTLRDIGMSRATALHESGKPFWKS